jgi:hypothetical protein
MNSLLKRRLFTLAEALVYQPNEPFQCVASRLYEAATGKALQRDTDPQNGEDYFYQGDPLASCSSLALHPEVAIYFTGWNNRFLETETWGGTRTSSKKLNADLASYIYESWQEFLTSFSE